MSENKDYSPWLGQELKKILDLISSHSYRNDHDILHRQISEVQRGIDYGLNNPGSIDDLLLKVGRNLVDSLQVYLRQMKPRTQPGIPPGGQPTILTGGGGIDSSSNSSDSAQFSVDELKGALASRKKKSVESKMKGSLDLLKEYEE